MWYITDFLKEKNSHFILTIVLNSIKSGRIFNHFLTVHWPWNIQISQNWILQCTMPTLCFWNTVLSCISLLREYQLIKDVFKASQLHSEPDYQSWLFGLLFCLLSHIDESEGLELREKEKVNLCSFLKSTFKRSLISELLVIHFQEIEEGFQILLYWKL